MQMAVFSSFRNMKLDQNELDDIVSKVLDKSDKKNFESAYDFEQSHETISPQTNRKQYYKNKYA